MKTFLFCLLSLALGFAASRLVSVAPDIHGSGPAKAYVIKSAPPPTAVPVKSARSISLEGDWKPAAEAWAAEDPEGFCRWLVERGMPPGAEVLNVLFGAWVQQDADAAFTAAFNLPADYRQADRHTTKPLLDHMLHAALSQTGGLERILKWLPQAEEQIDLWNETSGTWIHEKPLEEMGAFLAKNLSGENFSRMMLNQFAAHWVQQDPRAALAWVHTLNPAQSWGAFRGLLETWSRGNPKGALDYLAAEGSTAERANAYIALSTLAKTDPKAALAWWDKNTGLPDEKSAHGIFKEWTRINATEAFENILAIEDPTMRNFSLQTLIEESKSADLLKSLAGLSDRTTRQTILDGMSFNPVHVKESGADLRNLIAQGPASGATPEIASRVSAHYARENPAAALEWVTTLPPSFQDQSARTVLSGWLENDRPAATQAVENLPDGPAKTAARQVLK